MNTYEQPGRGIEEILELRRNRGLGDNFTYPHFFEAPNHLTQRPRTHPRRPHAPASEQAFERVWPAIPDERVPIARCPITPRRTRQLCSLHNPYPAVSKVVPTRWLTHRI